MRSSVEETGTSAGRAFSVTFSASSHLAQRLHSSERAMLNPAKEREMSTLHSLLDNLVVAGIAYSWRIDAIVLGVLLWALTVSYTQVRAAIA